MAILDTGWITAIALGAVLVVLVVVMIVWVFMRRRADLDAVSLDETVREHEAHSISRNVNDRWDALMKSWEEERDKHKGK